MRLEEDTEYLNTGENGYLVKNMLTFQFGFQSHQCQTFPHITNTSEAVAGLMKPYILAFAQRSGGLLRSLVMEIKDLVNFNEQSLIVYIANSRERYLISESRSAELW